MKMKQPDSAATRKDPFVRFDMKKPPMRQQQYLRPLLWALTLPNVLLNGSAITKEGVEGLKPPFLLLCNHNAFYDFSVATKAIFPARANYVVAIDGFIGREWLLRAVGGICKRKFTNDVQLIRQIRQVFKNGDVLVLYPEARYSLCGTTAVLPDSLGKLCRSMGVPVASLICHGHHVNSPFWNLKKRRVKGMSAEMKLLFTPEELKNLPLEEINRRIRKAFVYDDFAWQKARGIRVKAKFRAEGLHRVLYQCPACHTEYRMGSKGSELFCEACGQRWEMTELGELKAIAGSSTSIAKEGSEDSLVSLSEGSRDSLVPLTEGSGETDPIRPASHHLMDQETIHIPDWYEWQRANVRAEVEAGTYCFSGPCHVDSLPNAKGYIRLGEGTLTHDMNGFHVSGEGKYSPFSMEIAAKDQYSVHIEYNYLGKHGDCVDLNTLQDTFYTYPHGRDFAVTKMALATEELYYHYHPEKVR